LVGPRPLIAVFDQMSPSMRHRLTGRAREREPRQSRHWGDRAVEATRSCGWPRRPLVFGCNDHLSTERRSQSCPNRQQRRPLDRAWRATPPSLNSKPLWDSNPGPPPYHGVHRFRPDFLLAGRSTQRTGARHQCSNGANTHPGRDALAVDPVAESPESVIAADRVRGESFLDGVPPERNARKLVRGGTDFAGTHRPVWPLRARASRL